MKQNFNKSQIMQRAHYIRRHSWNCSMSEALKQAWREVKRNLSESIKSSNLMNSMKRTKADERNAQLYKNVIFGKNDWAVSYGRRYRF